VREREGWEGKEGEEKDEGRDEREGGEGMVGEGMDGRGGRARHDRSALPIVLTIVFDSRTLFIGLMSYDLSFRL